MCRAHVTIDGAFHGVTGSESGLIAHISNKRDDVGWEIKFDTEVDEAAGEQPPEFFPASGYLFFNIPGTENWSDLVGKSFSGASPPQRLLPDDSAGFYRGDHEVTDQHAIRFAERRHNDMQIEWTFVVIDDIRQTVEHHVRVAGWLPLLGAVVKIGNELRDLMSTTDDAGECERIFANWEPDWSLADQTLARFFDRSQFTKPVKWRGPVYYPMKRHTV